MATKTIKLYNALMQAGVDENTARTVSEEVIAREEDVTAIRSDLGTLTARLNIMIGINIASFIALLALLFERVL